MKRKPMLVLFVLTLAFTGSVLADDPAAARTVGYYMKTQTAPEWKNWIAGIGVGFGVANQELINRKRDPLFCFSGAYEPDPKAVLDAWIAKDRARSGMIHEHALLSLSLEDVQNLYKSPTFICAAGAGQKKTSRA